MILASLFTVWGEPMLFLRQVSYLIGAALLVACQTGGPPAVSLEEAKQITATFEGAFTPPPRTISDISAMLDEAASTDSDIVNTLRANADAEPPSTTDTEELAEFYVRRGESARLLGRHRQGIEDATKALALSLKVEHSVYRTLSFNHEELGNYSLAADFARKAIKASRSRGGRMTSNALLAVMLAHIGDFDGAETALSSARSMVGETYKWRGRGAVWAPPVRNFVDLLDGQVAYLRGSYSEAEAKLRKTHGAIEDDIANGAAGRSVVGAHGQTLESYRILNKAYALRALGQSLMHQGRLAEAEVVARDALVTQARFFGRNSGQTAEGVSALMETLVEQGRFEESATLAKATAEILEKMGVDPNSMTLAVARRSLMNSEIGQSRWNEATQVFDRLTHDLGSDPEGLTRFLTGNLTWALALIRTGRGGEAARRLAAIHRRLAAGLGPRHYATAEAMALLGCARAAGGDADGALADLSKATPVLMSRQGRSDTEDSTETGRRLRLRFILETYLDVLWRRTKQAGGDADAAAAEAFRVANFSRAGTVERALGASAARAAARDPELADLARREQDALHRIAALNGRLTDAAGDTKALLKRIGLLKASRKVIMAEITARFPDYADLINPRPATVEQARAVLRPGEALISTYVSEGKTYVWAVPREGEVAFVAADIRLEDLTDTVAMLRSALEPNAQTLGDIPDFDVAAAHDLYRKLLEPVKAGWEEAESLLVVAHGPMGYLPLSVLPTEPVELAREEGVLFANYRDIPWLAHDHAVTMLPSVASLRTLRGLPPGDAERRSYAGFGDPVFSKEQMAETTVEKPVTVAELTARGLQTRGMPVHLRASPKTTELDSAELARLPRLPDTADEIRGTAIALDADLTQDVFLGARANEQMVKTMDLSGYKVIAFATHGLVPGDLNGLLQPALALSAPEVAGVEGDGLLTMGEILGLKLDADWVVLSACNTGSGEGAGAEAVSGLGRAFFYAGTRALLVSNWPVETTSAKVLTIDLFRRQAEDPDLTRAEALRQAMLGLIDGEGYVDPESGKTVFSYAHPIFWAPFSLIGDGGANVPQS